MICDCGGSDDEDDELERVNGIGDFMDSLQDYTVLRINPHDEETDATDDLVTNISAAMREETINRIRNYMIATAVHGLTAAIMIEDRSKEELPEIKSEIYTLLTAAEMTPITADLLTRQSSEEARRIYRL